MSSRDPFDDQVPHTIALCVTDNDMPLPAEAARRLGVPTPVVAQAMYEKRIRRVKLEDGTLGIPADALDLFQAYGA